MFSSVALGASFVAVVLGHANHDQTPISGPHKALWYEQFNISWNMLI